MTVNQGNLRNSAAIRSYGMVRRVIREPALSRYQVRAISAPVVEIYRIDDEVKVINGLPGATMDAIELRLEGFTLSNDVDRD